jgi:NAD(P)-dependent dehydrogenase (short-subunit alcohol dehydrogenase family)
MTQELAGRIALVTGASSGLGRAFALRFAKEGARVAVAARRVELLTQLVEEIAAQGGEALPLVMDVTSAASIVDGYTLLSERWGSADIVIVNAGISSQALAIDLVVEDLDRILDINVRGAFLTAREGAKAMIAGGSARHKRGRIVFIASIGGQRALPGLAAYCASKAALIMLGQSLAREWINKGINVNVVCPGYISTELNAEWFESNKGREQVARFPRRRLMQACDLEDMVTLLSSGRSSAITGSVFTLDDGQSL